jgi:predicted DNA-binding antitoxin AbrB/MazE fold protein
MTYHIDAIYEGGVLKPIEPLILPEQSRVKVTVEAAPTPDAAPEVLAKQQAALQQLWVELDEIPQHQNNDGWSVVDHDRLLYDELQQ